MIGLFEGMGSATLEVEELSEFLFGSGKISAARAAQLGTTQDQFARASREIGGRFQRRLSKLFDTDTLRQRFQGKVDAEDIAQEIRVLGHQALLQAPASGSLRSIRQRVEGTIRARLRGQVQALAQGENSVLAQSSYGVSVDEGARLLGAIEDQVQTVTDDGYRLLSQGEWKDRLRQFRERTRGPRAEDANRVYRELFLGGSPLRTEQAATAGEMLKGALQEELELQARIADLLVVHKDASQEFVEQRQALAAPLQERLAEMRARVQRQLGYRVYQPKGETQQALLAAARELREAAGSGKSGDALRPFVSRYEGAQRAAVRDWRLAQAEAWLLGGKSGLPQGSVNGLSQFRAENREAFLRFHDAILEAAEASGVRGPVTRGGYELAYRNGELGIILYGDEARQHRLFYRKGGKVESLRDGTLVTDLSDVSRRVLSEEQFTQGLTRTGTGAGYADLTDPFAARELEQEFLQRAVGQGHLPVYRTGDRNIPIGFRSQTFIDAAGSRQAVTDLKSLQRTTQQLFGPDSPFDHYVSLDLETLTEGPNQGQIANISATRYQRGADGNFVRTTTRFNAASPEMWREVGRPGQADALEALLQKGQAIPAGLRQISRHGQETTISQVLRSDRMVNALAQFLKQNPGPVLGHNITFDVGALLEQSRGNAHAVFQGLRGRLVDTGLMAQAAFPQASRYSLEDLAQRFLGRTLGAGGNLWKEAHLADLDESLAAEFANALQSRWEQINRTLAGAEQLQLQPGQLLWNAREGRAYRFAGILDPEATREVFRRRGQEFASRYGMVLNPVDFETGQVSREAVVKQYRTPQGLASVFAADFRIADAGEIEQLMHQRVQDLAGRRVRRAVEGADAFENYLKDAERIRLLGRSDAAGSLTGLAHRAMQSPSLEDRTLLSQVADWMLDPRLGGDSRMRAQIQRVGGEGSFFAGEGALHDPVAEWLQGFTRAGDRTGLDRKETYRRASLVWEEYMRQVEGLFGEGGGWQRRTNVAIPEVEQQLSLHVPILGKNPVAVRVGSAALAQRDLEAAGVQVLKKVAERQPDRLARLFSPDELKTVRDLVRDETSGVLDTGLGGRLKDWVWEEFLRPALAANSQHRLQSGEFWDAVQELAEEGRRAAQQVAAQIPDYTRGREWIPERKTALAEIQARLIGTKEEPANVFAAVDAALADAGESSRGLVFDLRHNVPSDWVDRSAAELIGDAVQRAGGEKPYRFLDTLQSAVRRMTATDQAELETLLNSLAPADWAGEVFGKKRAGLGPFRMMAAPPVPPQARQFRPNAAIGIGEKMADFFAQNRGGFKSAGAAGLALLAFGALGLAARRPEAPPEEEAGEGFASTPGERERRRERVLKEVAQPHRLSVRIDADDPHGMSHEELTTSIHSALGSFFGQEVQPQVAVQDQRRRMDRDYLDRMAADLMQWH